MTEERGDAQTKKGSVDIFIGDIKMTSPESRAMFAELRNQTDRGMAILGAAWLDWRISELIRGKFSTADHVADDLLGTVDKTGRLEYGDRCKLAYCLGLIGPKILKDLQTIGTIRNRFAHRFKVTHFDRSQSIRDLCNSFEFYKGMDCESMEIRDARTRFHVLIPTLDIFLSLAPTRRQEMPDSLDQKTYW